MGRTAVEAEETLTYQPEADLVCKCANHAKEYRVQLVQCENGWSVTCQSGAIGSAMRDQPNRATGVDYQHAKKAFNKVVSEKLSKNPPYKLIAGAAPALPAGGRILERGTFSPELLTRKTEREVIALAASPRYVFQAKRDDRRLVGVVRKGERFGHNKNGDTITLPAEVAVAMGELCAVSQLQALMLDGEIEKKCFCVWDLLEMDIIDIPTGDIKIEAYRRRYNVLKQLLENVPSQKFIQLIETAFTMQEKISLLKRAHEEGWEGIVVKDLEAPYAEGRAGQHFKLKFEQTVSVIVGKKEKPNDHRSVGIYVVNGGGKLHYLGDVGVPDKYPLPPIGAVIDVRVLYQHSLEGKATQAKYFGKVRDDVRPDQCTREQLRVKQAA